MWNVPPILKSKTLSSLEGISKEIAVAVQAVQAGRSVTLYGAPGRGKSHLAYALVREIWVPRVQRMAAPDGHVAKWLEAPEFFFEVKQTYNKDSKEDEEQVMSRYSWTDLLILDDLGAEKVTDWSRQLLYLLIDRRYRNNLQTIITTNLTPEQLAETIDARIVSRLAEMGAVIELKGSDKRVSKVSGRR